MFQRLHKWCKEWPALFYGCTASVSHHCSTATSSNSATSACAFQVPWQRLVNSHIRYFFSQMIRQSSDLDYMAVSDGDYPDKVLRTESFPLLMRQDSSRCTFNSSAAIVETPLWDWTSTPVKFQGFTPNSFFNKDPYKLRTDLSFKYRPKPTSVDSVFGYYKAASSF